MTSSFDVNEALDRASRRFGTMPAARRRKPRADRGRFRMAAAAERELRRLVMGHDRTPMTALLSRLRAGCERAEVSTPSRATVYNYLARVRTPERRVAELPRSVQQALYNLTPDSWVPEAQIAFYCFNYGDLGAVSFAAGLPWLALYQARRMRGWRRRSLGLAAAVARVRRI